MCRVGEEEIGEGRAEIDEVEAGGRGRGARGCFDWARVNGMHKEDRNERRRTEGECKVNGERNDGMVEGKK